MIFARRRLLKAIDTQRVERAIADAERQTSGEIRVSVAPFFWGDVRKAADLAFDRLGLRQTVGRNGVLFFVVPARRRFVVLGDEGIHAKVGEAFWLSVADAVATEFKKGDFTEGLVRGIATVGRELAAHFPYDPVSDRNDPNEVAFH